MGDTIVITDHRQAPAGDALEMIRTWQAPRLAVLGEVRSLTEAGSGGNIENPSCSNVPEHCRKP